MQSREKCNIPKSPNFNFRRKKKIWKRKGIFFSQLIILGKDDPVCCAPRFKVVSPITPLDKQCGFKIWPRREKGGRKRTFFEAAVQKEKYSAVVGREGGRHCNGWICRGDLSLARRLSLTKAVRERKKERGFSNDQIGISASAHCLS